MIDDRSYKVYRNIGSEKMYLEKLRNLIEFCAIIWQDRFLNSLIDHRPSVIDNFCLAKEATFIFDAPDSSYKMPEFFPVLSRIDKNG
ncbi:hypothetical protein C5B42_00335, partial [Candidatus Cerribacteria bacterium 'Amazon FNV 2010 28 9']